jgi:hypothetical protein
LCKSKVTKRGQDRDGHHPCAFGACRGGVRRTRGDIVRGSSAIGLGHGGRRAAGTAGGGDRSANILAGRLRAGRQLTKESVLSRECAVGHVDLLHAFLGMRAPRTVGWKTVRMELLDESPVTPLHSAPVVPAGTEAKGPIPEGDVLVGHGSDVDASLLGERADRALRDNRNVIRDSRWNLTRGDERISARRERHARQHGRARRLTGWSSTLPLVQRGTRRSASEDQSHVMRVIQLNSVPSDGLMIFRC